MACVTLAFEYWWYKYKKNPRIEATNEKENQRKINTWNTQDRFGPDFKDYYTNFP